MIACYLFSLSVPIIAEYKVTTRIFKPLFSKNARKRWYFPKSFFFGVEHARVEFSCFYVIIIEASGFFSGSSNFFHFCNLGFQLFNGFIFDFKMFF